MITRSKSKKLNRQLSSSKNTKQFLQGGQISTYNIKQLRSGKYVFNNANIDSTKKILTLNHSYVWEISANATANGSTQISINPEGATIHTRAIFDVPQSDETLIYNIVESQSNPGAYSFQNDIDSTNRIAILRLNTSYFWNIIATGSNQITLKRVPIPALAVPIPALAVPTPALAMSTPALAILQDTMELKYNISASNSNPGTFVFQNPDLLQDRIDGLFLDSNYNWKIFASESNQILLVGENAQNAKSKKGHIVKAGGNGGRRQVLQWDTSIPIIPLQVQKNKEYRQKHETLIRERKRAREHAIEIDDD